MERKRSPRIVGLILAVMVFLSFGNAVSAFNVGDTVEVTANLNVRTGAGTSYPEITDPDYSYYAPTGTTGEVLSGPASANDYIWWNIDYGPGLYSGWSVEDWLETVETVPSPPTPTSPGSGSGSGPTIDTLTPTLQWGGVSNADYYALAISKYPHGTSNIVYNPQQVYGTSLTVPSGELVYGEKYRWNMQAHNSAGWSDISNTLYFQTPTTTTSTTTTTTTTTTTSSTTSTATSSTTTTTLNQPPNLPTSLSQLKSDSVTEIPEGGTTAKSTVVFNGTVYDPDGDQVRLEIELRQKDEPFTGEPTPETISDFVPSGSEVTITRYGLVNADYRWQYRAKDSKGDTNQWVEFGKPENTDFTVKAQTPTDKPYPVVTSSLKILQSSPYYVGDTITAQFTITNKGTALTTFDILTVGGQLNEICPEDKCPDFTWNRGVSLDPSDSHQYEGSLILDEPGDYYFFTAYRIDGNWNTAIATESGVGNVVDIAVNLIPTQTTPTPESTVDNPKWTGDFYDDSDQMILARAIFGEARGEVGDGKIAVGWVIRNRVERSPFWGWSNTYHRVILQKEQFSTFNPYTLRNTGRTFSQKEIKNYEAVLNPSGDEWYECYEIAGQILSNKVNDPTGGADHFHRYTHTPPWADRTELTTQIGNHLFYRFYPEEQKTPSSTEIQPEETSKPEKPEPIIPVQPIIETIQNIIDKIRSLFGFS